MKVNRMKCDRCALETPLGEPSRGLLRITLRYRRLDKRHALTQRKSLDLCQTCREDFAAWLGDEKSPIGLTPLPPEVPMETDVVATPRAPGGAQAGG